MFLQCRHAAQIGQLTAAREMKREGKGATTNTPKSKTTLQQQVKKKKQQQHLLTTVGTPDESSICADSVTDSASSVNFTSPASTVRSTVPIKSIKTKKLLVVHNKSNNKAHLKMDMEKSKMHHDQEPQRQEELERQEQQEQIQNMLQALQTKKSALVEHEKEVQTTVEFHLERAKARYVSQNQTGALISLRRIKRLQNELTALSKAQDYLHKQHEQLILLVKKNEQVQQQQQQEEEQGQQEESIPESSSSEEETLSTTAKTNESSLKQILSSGIHGFFDQVELILKSTSSLPNQQQEAPSKQQQVLVACDGQVGSFPFSKEHEVMEGQHPEEATDEDLLQEFAASLHTDKSLAC